MTEEGGNERAPLEDGNIQPEESDECDGASAGPRRVQPWKATWPQQRKDEDLKPVNHEYDDDLEERAVLSGGSGVVMAKGRDERAPSEDRNIQPEESVECDGASAGPKRVQPWKATWPQQSEDEGLKPVDHEYDDDLKGITVLCGRGGYNDHLRGSIFDLDDIADTNDEGWNREHQKEPTAHTSYRDEKMDD